MIRISPYWRRALRRIATHGSLWHHPNAIERLPVYVLEDIGLTRDWRGSIKPSPPFPH